MSGFYSQYKGQCVGRLMFWLYKLNRYSDNWTYDESYIYGAGHRKIGRYTWLYGSDIPVFYFFDADTNKLYKDQHRYNIKTYIENKLKM